MITEHLQNTFKSLISEYCTVMHIFNMYDTGHLNILDEEESLKVVAERTKYSVHIGKQNIQRNMIEIVQNIFSDTSLPVEINKIIKGEQSNVINKTNVANAVSIIKILLNYRDEYVNFLPILYKSMEKIGNLSFEVFVRLAQYHAFSDGNKRTAFIYAMYIAYVLNNEKIRIDQNKQEHIAKMILLYYEKKSSNDKKEIELAYDNMKALWISCFI